MSCIHWKQGLIARSDQDCPYCGIESLRQQLATTKRLLAESQAREKAPVEAIGTLLEQAMEIAVANGANSVSMPDEYVAIAWWLSKYKTDSTALDAAIAKAKREENEACAKVCEVMGNNGYSGGWSIAKAIRSSLANELKGGEQG